MSGAYLLLTNAIYFKAKFQIRFEKRLTRRQSFHLANGRVKEVEMMRARGLDGAYRVGKGFEAAVLGYLDTHVALFMVLPNKGKAPEKALTDESLREMVRSNNETTLNLELSRFTMEFSHSLKDSLIQMGMGIAFKFPGADFSAMGSPLAYVNDVAHKTLIEIDEEGTVAAAATDVLCLAASLRPPDAKTLVFDRPFALMLRDMKTRTVLFLGVVYEP
jgi:serine protease inhibitor